MQSKCFIENLKLISSGITSVITEPGRVILHFQKTRKTGFACITLLSAGCWVDRKFSAFRFYHGAFWRFQFLEQHPKARDAVIEVIQ